MNGMLQKVVAVLALSGMSLAQAAQTGASTPKKRTATKAKAAAKAPAVTAEDLQQLRQMLEQQQQQLQQLQQQMAQRDQQLQQTQQQLTEAQAAAKDAQSKTTILETTTNENKEGVAKVKSDVEDIRGTMTSQVLTAQEDQKKVSDLAGEVKRFRFTGDVRVRYENFFQDNVQDRNRERIRARFGVEGKLAEDFIGGIFRATGVLTDPTSTNETLTNVFEKKTIGLDRGYITYNPHYFKPLSLTGGKFAYTWNRTPVTFDSDLNPEGFTQKFSFDVKTPFVKNLTFQGIQLLYNEASAGADSYAVGGQVASRLQLGNFWTMTPSYTILNWHNDNIILNEPTAVTGAATVGPFAPNGMTNCTVTVGTVRSFCSQFLYSDLILNNVFKTGIAKLPFNLLAEYEVNLNAASNRSHSYYFDASLGQTKNKNDFQFGYAFIRQEQDSVIASFNESDQRAPTNVVQHRVAFNWKVARNTTFGYTQWIGRTLDPTQVNARLAPGVSTTGSCAGAPAGACLLQDPWLKRGQLDLVFTF
jgi:hypothetical protein